MKADQAGKVTNELMDKFNHGITFGETAALSRRGKACLPGKDYGEQEEDGEGEESVKKSLVLELRTE